MGHQNVKAVTFPYAEALAQSLKELDEDFDAKMKEYDKDTEDEYSKNPRIRT